MPPVRVRRASLAPLGRTEKTSSLAPTVRTKAIARPSAEKSASWSSAAPLVSGCRPPPWERTVYRSAGPPAAVRRSKTTSRPSGETTGFVSRVGPLVSCRSPEPSARTEKRWLPRTKAIEVPSGEKAGSVSVGSSVSWLRRPSLTAKRPPSTTVFVSVFGASPGFGASPSTFFVSVCWVTREKTTAPEVGAAPALAGTARTRSASSAVTACRMPMIDSFRWDERCPTDAAPRDRTRQRHPRPPSGHVWPGPSHATAPVRLWTYKCRRVRSVGRGQRSRPSSITRAAIWRGRSRPASPLTPSLAARASRRRWAVRSLTWSDSAISARVAGRPAKAPSLR